MEWYDQYSVHIGQMDRQHRKILTILNGIYYLEENDRRGLEQIFRSLESCIHSHFADEEDLLLLHDYPGYDEQKQEHERFIDEICSYRQEFVKGRTPVMINVFNGVWDRLSQHILVLDKRYEPFLQARGCR